MDGAHHPCKRQRRRRTARLSRRALDWIARQVTLVSGAGGAGAPERCLVCYDEPEARCQIVHRANRKCCGGHYCLACVARWLVQDGRCALCREAFCVQQVVAIT